MIDDRLIARVAELYYMYDINQDEIARKFKFSKAKVCRILKEAKNRKIIQFSLRSFNNHDIDLEKELEKRFNLKEAIVYTQDNTIEQDEDFNFREVGILGAKYVKRILKNDLNIGLTWGTTLYSVIKNLNSDKKYKINIFSTLGGISLSKAEYQNNNLVQMMVEKVGGSGYLVYLPLLLEKKEHKEIISENSIGIDKVIGDISNLDFYFCSVGSISAASRLRELGNFENNFFQEIEAKGICGEIGLNFYNIDGNFINAGIENRTIHLNIEDIKKIKNKIVISSGKLKVKPLVGILRAGIPDILITDSVTANMVLDYK